MLLIILLIIFIFILLFLNKKTYKTDINHIKRLKNEIKAEVRPSKIHGVGVFAIENIPNNTILFSNVENDTIKLDYDDLESNLSKNQYKLFAKLSDYRSNKYWTTNNFNLLPITSFFNHSSDNPNITWNEKTNEWITIKNIQKNEEFLWNYNESNDELNF